MATMRDEVSHLCHTAHRKEARPAGLEPATLGLEGRGNETTGGSGKPLPPFYWGSVKPPTIGNHPEPLPIVSHLSVV